MKDAVVAKILEQKLIAIVRGVYGQDFLRLAEALLKGGVSLIEVTFDQARPETIGDTAAAIMALNSEFSGAALAGAGTVTTPALVEIAADAGAKYIISPNVDEAVIDRTAELGMASLPGALTPTEILAARAFGADLVKVFPAAAMGPGYIKAVKAPLNDVGLLAVGGIDAGNIRSFLEAGACGAGVGGKLVDKKLIAAGDFAAITSAARALVAAVRR